MRRAPRRGATGATRRSGSVQVMISKLAVFVLGERGAAFHPVAAVHVADAVLVADGGVVDVAADHAVGAVTPRLGGQRLFERRRYSSRRS